MADFLCAAATHINAADTDGHTPLWIACEINDSGRVRQLLALGAEPNVSNSNGDDVALILDAVAL
jgi:ankyrin repeat protein